MKNEVVNICIIEDDDEEKGSYCAINNWKIGLDILWKVVKYKCARG